MLCVVVGGEGDELGGQGGNTDGLGGEGAKLEAEEVVQIDREGMNWEEEAMN